MLKITTNNYNNKKEAQSTFGDIGRFIGSAAGSASKKLWQLGKDVTSDPLFKDFLGGTGLGMLAKGVVDIGGSAGGGLTQGSGVLSIAERSMADQLSEDYKKDLQNEVIRASSFDDLSRFTKEIYCHWRNVTNKGRNSISGPDSKEFKSIMIKLLENYQFSSRYKNLIRSTGGTLTGSPTPQGEKLIKIINKNFYDWILNSMNKIEIRFGASPEVRNYCK